MSLFSTLFGGGDTGGSNTSTSLPQWLQQAYQGAISKANSAYAATSGLPRDVIVPGFAPEQEAAFGAVVGGLGQYLPQMDTAMGMAADYDPRRYDIGFWGNDAAAQYMNPYAQNVIDINKREASKDFQNSRNLVSGQAQAAGAFGGSRQGVVESELYNQEAKTLADIQNTGLASAYDTAFGNFNTDRNAFLESAAKDDASMQARASSLGSLAGQSQSMFYRDVGALSGVGEDRRALEQQYSDYYSQYPWEVAGNYSKTISGLPNGIGDTNTQTNAGPGNPLSALTGLAAIGESTGAFGAEGWLGFKKGGLVRKYATGGLTSNNPGNIVYDSRNDWQGSNYADNSEGRFESFETPTSGIRALSKLLSNYEKSYGLNTVEGIIARFAPAHENDTEGYANYVADRIGVQPGDALNVSDPTTMHSIVSAIIEFENGSNPYDPNLIRDGIAASLQGSSTDGRQGQIPVAPLPQKAISPEDTVVISKFVDQLLGSSSSLSGGANTQQDFYGRKYEEGGLVERLSDYFGSASDYAAQEIPNISFSDMLANVFGEDAVAINNRVGESIRNNFDWLGDLAWITPEERAGRDGGTPGASSPPRYNSSEQFRPDPVVPGAPHTPSDFGATDTPLPAQERITARATAMPPAAASDEFTLADFFGNNEAMMSLGAAMMQQESGEGLFGAMGRGIDAYQGTTDKQMARDAEARDQKMAEAIATHNQRMSEGNLEVNQDTIAVSRERLDFAREELQSNLEGLGLERYLTEARIEEILTNTNIAKLANDPSRLRGELEAKLTVDLLKIYQEQDLNGMLPEGMTAQDAAMETARILADNYITTILPVQTEGT